MYKNLIYPHIHPSTPTSRPALPVMLRHVTTKTKRYKNAARNVTKFPNRRQDSGSVFFISQFFSDLEPNQAHFLEITLGPSQPELPVNELSMRQASEQEGGGF